MNVCKALVDYLQAYGFADVVTAVNGTEGLSCAREHQPDLIISDMSMPQMDGYTFIQKLRSDSQLKRIPVLVLTGRDEVADVFKRSQIHDYLIKPFEPKLLLEKMRKMLEQRPSSPPQSLWERIKEIWQRKG